MYTGSAKKYRGSRTNYLRQCHGAAELMAEYLLRLETVGVRPGEGACFDEITCTSEQAESIERIFRELCLERGLKMREN